MTTGTQDLIPSTEIDAALAPKSGSHQKVADNKKG
jgi:hypothetical protein